MSMPASAVFMALLVSPGSASADPLASWGATSELRMGSVTAPFYTQALSETSSEMLAKLVVFEGFYRLSPHLKIGARLPFAVSSVRQPAGSYSEASGLGNPELYVEDSSFSGAFAAAKLRASARLGVAIPGAQHASSLLQNRVGALSNALDGWRNPELYEAGVVPLTLSARAGILPKPFGALLSVKIPVLIRINDASLPEESRLRAIGIVPHIELRGTWKPRRWLAVHMASHVVFQMPASVSPPEGSERAGKVQLGVTPGLALQIAENWLLSLDVSAAIGGPLSGTFGSGLKIRFRR